MSKKYALTFKLSISTTISHSDVCISDASREPKSEKIENAKSKVN